MRASLPLNALLLASVCNAYFHDTTPSEFNPCGNCTYHEASYWAGWWTTATAVATASIEAVTVLVLTDDTTNATRTTTVFNFPPNAPVSTTDEAGFVVHTQTFSQGASTSTAVLTWPTGYVSYQQEQMWYGILPETEGINGQSCSTAPPSGAALAFPTPLQPVITAQGHFPDDDEPYNRDEYYIWTFYTGPNDAWCEWPFDASYATDYRDVESDLPVYQTCFGPQGTKCPPQALTTEAYLTVTHTTAEAQATLIAPAYATEPANPLPGALGSSSPAPTSKTPTAASRVSPTATDKVDTNEGGDKANVTSTEQRSTASLVRWMFVDAMFLIVLLCTTHASSLLN